MVQEMHTMALIILAWKTFLLNLKHGCGSWILVAEDQHVDILPNMLVYTRSCFFGVRWVDLELNI